MLRMERRTSLPDANRIGVLTAAVLLAFALTRLIAAPVIVLRLALGNFYLLWPLSLPNVMTLLAAGLTATGMDWLLRGHPAFKGRSTLEHWLLPTLTTVVVGIPLALLPNGPAWWMAFAVAGLLLVVVFLAEYTVVDSAAPSYALATIVLTALSFAIYLILLTALRFAGLRLILFLPSVFLASGLLSLRALHLRLHGRWEFLWSGGVALVSAQLAAALHYWPITPLQFALALLGPLYALTLLAGSLEENTPVRRASMEPLVAVILSWAAAALLR